MDEDLERLGTVQPTAMEHTPELGGRDARAITEIDLAALTGVERRFLREARRAMPEGSVESVPGSGVFWHQEAVEALCADLKMPEVPARLWPEVSEQASRDATVRVERIPRNPRLLFCRDGEGRAVRVRVKRNDRFVPQMELPVRFTGPDSGVAVLTRKLPRRKGCW